MMTRILIFAAFALLSLNGFGQGTIRGKVTSMEGEVIPYATVRIKGENKGGTTDFDGLYTIKSVPAGTYTLIFSASLDGFIDQEVEGVQVISGQVTEINKSLTKDSSVLVVAGVSVVRKGIGPGTGQEEIDIKRQNDPGPTDGMGRKQMQQSGVGNAAEGAQMVPGISVEGGKRIYVRGLGDRYTKTLLNGMEIPGLDPDRNTVQLDIFPSTLVDNITVYKSFVPNWSGDYTGGLVNITTRDFPAKKFTYFSGGIGYNQFATFNKDYIGYKGGSFDFLGFDDGTRGLPFNKFTIIPDATSSNSSQLESLLRTFNPTMAVSQRPTFVDQNYTFSIGNQKNKEDSDFSYGYNFVLNYRNQYRFYGDAQFNEFRRINADENLLFRDRASNGQLGENDVMLTGLFGQSFKFKKKNKISVNLFHVQNGKSSASFLEQENFETNPGILEKQALQYTQRSISNLNISGLHLLDTANRWKFEWKVAPSFARVYDPDIRSTALEREINGSDTTYLLAAAVGAEVRRIYRNLNEFNVPVRMDFTHKFTQWDSLKSELRFGVSDVYKTRSFTTYDLNFTADNMTVFSNDPDWYFEEEQLWSVAADSGIVVKGQNEPANNFDASINIAGAYIMNDLPLSKRFKATYGVRAEHALYKFTGSDVSGTEIFNDSTVLNNFNVLPSVNLVYKIEKEADSVKYKRVTNFRGAYSQTVARPSFREKSKAAIYDPIQGRRYNGNMDLLQTTIHNADLRWEYFFGRVELISFSAFYKRFINPIEITAFRKNPRDVKPVNAGIADVYGGEFEARKAIGFNNPDKPYRALVLGANFTYVVSKVDMNEILVDDGGSGQITQKEDRIQNARPGEVIGDFRPMYGQSPYIANAFLTFQNDSLKGKFGLVMNMSYNVQGKRLAVIGVGQLPDVYEQPFHSLNFKASFKFGEEQRWKASIAAQNLLMQKRRRSYESYGDYEALKEVLGDISPDDYINQRLYDYFYEGITVTGSISWTLSGKVKK